MFYLSENIKELWQWDLDMVLVVENNTIEEVHFANRTMSNALVRDVYEEEGLTLVKIPNVLLQKPYDLKVYAFDGKHTKYEQVFKVNGRPKPETYVYTETEKYKIEEVVDESVARQLQELKDSGEITGPSGKSAYEYALEGGYEGTEEEFMAELAEGGGIVDVDELPTENINEKVLYRTTVDDVQSYYGYNNNKSSQLVNITDTPEINGDIAWDGVIGDKIVWDPASNYYGSEQMVRVSGLVIPEEYLEGNRVLITSSSHGYESTCDSTIWKSDLLENAYEAYDENSSSTMLPRVIYLLKDTVADEQELKAGVYFVYKEVSQLYTVSAVLQNSYKVAPKKLLPTEFKQAFKDSDIVSDAIVDVEELPTEDINDKAFYRVETSTIGCEDIYVFVDDSEPPMTILDIRKIIDPSLPDITIETHLVDELPSELLPPEGLNVHVYVVRDTGIGATNPKTGDNDEVPSFMLLSGLVESMIGVSVPDKGWIDSVEDITQPGVYALRSNVIDYTYYAHKNGIWTLLVGVNAITKTLPNDFWEAFEAGMTVGGKY